MTFWQLGTKLPEPLMPYHQMKKISWNLNKNLAFFIKENAFESVTCKMVTILFINSSPPSAGYMRQ